MPTAAVVANPRVGAELGHIGNWLETHGFGVQRLTRDDVLASDAADDCDVLILLGSVWTMTRPMTSPPVAQPAIAAECDLVRHWLATDRPLLGVCFGAQLLSRILGGDVVAQEVPYVGWITPAAEIEALRSPWMLWHEDRFTVPPGAELLAAAAHAPLAFRYGRAWGVQWHPEVDADILQRMAEDLHASPEAAAPMVAVARERAPQQRAESMAMLDAWWADVS